jgi:hypothetical protein
VLKRAATGYRGRVRSHSRSLTSYLLLPRPGDLVKMLFFPVSFLLGCVSREVPDLGTVVRAAAVWLVLELLVYQARYQWNDIRGFAADQRHADGDRGRLPGPWERRRSRIAWSAGTAVAKVVLALGVGVALGHGTEQVVALLCVGVFLSAAAYEALRSIATGRSAAVPARATTGVVGIWILIGAGYALRAVSGLGMAVDLGNPSALLPVAVATCWLFGIAWITSRWAVEATASAVLGPDGELEWRVTPDQAREHLLALVRWLPARPPTSTTDLRRWRPVRGCPSPSAPWFVAGVLTSAGAALTGALLADPAVGATALVLIGLAGLVAGVGVHVAGIHRALAVALGAALTWAVVAVNGLETPALAVLPWLVASIAQQRYLVQDRASLGQLGQLPHRRPRSDARHAAHPSGPTLAPAPTHRAASEEVTAWTSSS